MATRQIQKIWQSQATMEGAGVRLKRAFGFNEVPGLDPFLLLDDFGSDNPEDYLAGFPWHPHRGIETVTYMLHGRVEHGDSIGNSGVIASGDVQWMTAGSGIIHQEMPQLYKGRSRGFQLWVNLPKRNKMMPPRYRGLAADEIPRVEVAPGITAKIISGELAGVKGPVQDIVVDVEYYDFTMQPGNLLEHRTKPGHTVFCYVSRGSGCFEPGGIAIDAEQVMLFSEGDRLRIENTGGEPLRFLMAAGEPLNEPIAWRGPIVMNTREELDIAFDEYHKGTFIKTSQAGEV